MIAPIPTPSPDPTESGFLLWLASFDPALARRLRTGEESDLGNDGFRAGRLSALYSLHRLRQQHGPDADILAIQHSIEEALLARRRDVIASNMIATLTAGTEGHTGGAEQLAEQHPEEVIESCTDCPCFRDGVTAACEIVGADPDEVFDALDGDES
ncbi:MAG TPA: hypothetical protein VJY35_10580 [Candidatus Eisenbacteria bacterium]|nr:hypothetical protein [Candidatus Eisenbacteria bacterium]